MFDPQILLNSRHPFLIHCQRGRDKRRERKRVKILSVSWWLDQTNQCLRWGSRCFATRLINTDDHQHDHHHHHTTTIGASKYSFSIFGKIRRIGLFSKITVHFMITIFNRAADDEESVIWRHNLVIRSDTPANNDQRDTRRGTNQHAKRNDWDCRWLITAHKLLDKTIWPVS